MTNKLSCKTRHHNYAAWPGSLHSRVIVDLWLDANWKELSHARSFTPTARPPSRSRPSRLLSGEWWVLLPCCGIRCPPAGDTSVPLSLWPFRSCCFFCFVVAVIVVGEMRSGAFQLKRRISLRVPSGLIIPASEWSSAAEARFTLPSLKGGEDESAFQAGKRVLKDPPTKHCGMKMNCLSGAHS